MTVVPLMPRMTVPCRLVVLPEAVWTQFPHALTMEGQYIIKNLVLVAAGMVLGGTVRGGYLEPEPALRTAVAQPQRTRRLMEM